MNKSTNSRWLRIVTALVFLVRVSSATCDTDNVDFGTFYSRAFSSSRYKNKHCSISDCVFRFANKTLDKNKMSLNRAPIIDELAGMLSLEHKWYHENYINYSTITIWFDFGFCSHLRVLSSIVFGGVSRHDSAQSPYYDDVTERWRILVVNGK